jgi:formyltetrahydrofolate deformylase
VSLQTAAVPNGALTLSCPDRIGIVADVSRFLAEHACNILESAQHRDPANGRFFMRTVFESTGGHGLAALQDAFAPVAARYAMDSRIFDAAAKTPTLIMVS